MIDANEPNAETADIDYIARRYRLQLFTAHAVLLQPSRQNTQRQPRTVNRHVNLLQHIRKRTDMVLMPVGEDDGLNLFAILQQIRNIGNHEINSQHIVLGEHQSCVDQQNLIVHAKNRHIFADLPQAAQRNDLQLLLSLRQKNNTSIFI